MRRLGLAALLTLLWSILMSACLKTFIPYPYESQFRQNVASPVLAIELSNPARDKAGLNPILRGKPLPQFENDKDNPAKAASAIRINTLLDLVFIPLYVWYFVELGWLLAGPQLARLLALLAIVAGVFDYIEDGFIWTVLRGGMLPVVIPSLIKWCLISLLLLIFAALLIRSFGQLYSLATDRLMGLAHLYAGVLVFLAVTCNRWFGYSWIETGSEIFGATVLMNAAQPIGLWFRRRFPGRKLVYIEDFCQHRSRGEKTSHTVRTG